MPLRDKTGPNSPALPKKERRLRRDAGVLARLVRALRGLIRRPVGVYRLDGRWRAGLVERRRAPGDALALRGIVTDLRERLLAQDADDAANTLSHLVQVHDQMRAKGWEGVMALPEPVRSRALFQAEMLARSAPSTAMTQLIDRLRAAHSAAAAPERAAAPAREGSLAPAEAAVEVSEASSDEFEASQRGWLETVPPVLPAAPAAKEPSS